MNEPLPLGALPARAVSLFVRRLALYVGVTVAALGIEALIAFTHVLPKNAAGDVPEAILQPLVALVAYVFTAYDAAGRPADFSPWARILERAWAVIVIDFIPVAATLFAPSNAATAGLLVIVSYALTLLLLFADVHAAIAPEVTTLTLIPAAIGRSIALVFRSSNMMPVIVLIVVQYGLQFAGMEIFGALTAAHVPDIAFWGQAPFDAVVCAPFAVLTTVFYFDCVAREAHESNQRD